MKHGKKYVDSFKAIDKAKADEEERLKNAPLQAEVTRRQKKPRPHNKK